MEQKSPEWFESRLGLFTASQVYKLLSGSRTKDQIFGDTGMTYIREKVFEVLTKGTSLDYQFQGNAATEWGNQFEHEARVFYERAKELTVLTCGFLRSEIEMFGGSPDGLVEEDGIIEIKCPYTANHVKFLTYSKEEFIKKEPEYYTQIQGNLFVTGRKWCDFISYDPRIQNDKFKMRVIRFERDEPFIANLKERLLFAVEEYNNLLDKIIKL